MKERFEIYDGSAEAKKAKGKSKNLSGFHPLFTASARRSIALDGLKIWLLLGFVVGVVTGVATGAGAVSVLLGYAMIYVIGVLIPLLRYVVSMMDYFTRTRV